MPTNNIDIKLLRLIQGDFPLVNRPFRHIANMLATDEGAVIDRIKAMKCSGIIRRIGPIFNPKAFGYKSCLIAAKVRDKDQIVGFINSLDGVTHNYERDGIFDIWFTLTYKHREDLDHIIFEMKDKYGVTRIIELPSIKTYKLKTDFSPPSRDCVTMENLTSRLAPLARRIHFNSVRACRKPITTQSPRGGDQGEGGQNQALHPSSRPSPPRGEGDSANVIATCVGIIIDLPIEPTPLDDNTILSILNGLNKGTVKRFGAIIDHNKVGYKYNAMLVWGLEEDKIDEAGSVIATFHSVSHCYRRGPAPGWTYNLYAMMHARDNKDAQEIIDALRSRVDKIASKNDFLELRTIKEYKKVSFIPCDFKNATSQ